MKQPDWSTAPEWATVFLRHSSDQALFAWAEKYQEDVRFLRDDGVHGYRLSLDCWVLVDTRPTTPQWNGEGLPPVGVVCECQNDKFQWLRGRIVYVGSDRGDKLAVMQADTEMLYGSVGEFRPIRTPEQIAAEERIAAINWMEIDAGMCATAFDGDPEARAWVENLIDKGWRKAGVSE